jgi:hypothetical protein
MGAQTTAALPVLPLGPDQPTQHERAEQAHHRVEEIADRD